MNIQKMARIVLVLCSFLSSAVSFSQSPTFDAAWAGLTQPRQVRDFAAARGNVVWMTLGVQTNVYNKHAEVRAAIDVARQVFIDVKYRHFATKTFDSPMVGVGTKTITSSSDKYCTLRVQVAGDRLEVSQPASPVGQKGRLRITKFDSRAAYEVTVTTGNDGTDANIFLTLAGSAGESSEIKLHSGLLIEKPGSKPVAGIFSTLSLFEKRSVHTFRVTTPKALGPIGRVRVRSDNWGAGPTWYLSNINVDGTAFNFRKSLSSAVPVLFATRTQVSTGPLDYPGMPSPNASATRATYTVTLLTGGLEHAGTDANIRVRLHGSEGVLNWITLRGTGTERGASDVVSIPNQKNIGTVEGLEIQHDGKGIRPDWFLGRAYVHCSATNERRLFDAARWLKKGQKAYLHAKPKNHIVVGDFFLEETLIKIGGRSAQDVFGHIVNNAEDQRVLDRFISMRLDDRYTLFEYWAERVGRTQTNMNNATLLSEARLKGNALFTSAADAPVWERMWPRIEQMLYHRGYALDYLNEVQAQIDAAEGAARDEIDFAHAMLSAQPGFVSEPTPAESVEPVNLQELFVGVAGLVPDPTGATQALPFLLSGMDQMRRALAPTVPSPATSRVESPDQATRLVFEAAGVRVDYSRMFREAQTSVDRLRRLIARSPEMMEYLSGLEERRTQTEQASVAFGLARNGYMFASRNALAREIWTRLLRVRGVLFGELQFPSAFQSQINTLKGLQIDLEVVPASVEAAFAAGMLTLQASDPGSLLSYSRGKVWTDPVISYEIQPGGRGEPRVRFKGLNQCYYAWHACLKVNDPAARPVKLSLEAMTRLEQVFQSGRGDQQRDGARGQIAMFLYRNGLLVESTFKWHGRSLDPVRQPSVHGVDSILGMTEPQVKVLHIPFGLRWVRHASQPFLGSANYPSRQQFFRVPVFGRNWIGARQTRSAQVDPNMPLIVVEDAALSGPDGHYGKGWAFFGNSLILGGPSVRVNG